MEDLSLEELQRQFQLVQEQDSAVRLSERNVVELVLYLMQQQKLKNLVYTMDGKEYITEEQITREISDQLIISGGRVSRLDLPGLLNVDLTHIERITDEMLADRDDMILIQGELITNAHLDTVCEEINEMLQESGCIALADLVRRLGLPNEFIFNTISHRLGRFIHGRLESETLYTNAFVQREKARIRGTFSALTSPTSLTEKHIASKFHGALFEPLLKELIREKKVAGTLSNRIYTPNVFQANIRNAVVNFLQQNGYIEYTRIDDMLDYKKNQNAAKNYVKQECPDAILLDRFAVNGALKDRLDSNIESAALDNTPLDLMSILPSNFEKGDTRKLLNLCSSMSQHKNLILFADSFIMTTQNVDEFVKLFEEKAKKDVKKLLTTAQAPAKSQPKGGDDDDEESGRKKGKKKPAQGSKKKGKRVEDDDDEDKQDILSSIIPQNEDMTATLEKFLLGNLPTDEEAIEEILQHVEPMIHDLYQKCRENLLMDSAAERRKQLGELEKMLMDIYNELWLNYKAIQVIRQKASTSEERQDQENSTDLADQLEKYLLKTKCQDLSYIIIRGQALHYNLDNELPPITTPSATSTGATSPTVSEAAEPTSQLIIPAQPLKVVLGRLPSAMAKSLNALLTSSQKGPVEAFFDQLTKTSQDCNIFLKPLDKKKERQLLLAKKQELGTSLEKDILNDPGHMILQLCIYFTIAKQNLLISAPGKLVPSIIKFFQYNNLKGDDDMISLFYTASNCVSNFIISKRKAQPGETSAQVNEEYEKMTSQLTKLKETVMQTKQNDLLEPMTPVTPVTPLGAATSAKKSKQQPFPEDDEPAQKSSKKKGKKAQQEEPEEAEEVQKPAKSRKGKKAAEEDDEELEADIKPKKNSKKKQQVEEEPEPAAEEAEEEEEKQTTKKKSRRTRKEN